MLYFDTIYGRQTNLLMAASVMNIVPLIILFVVDAEVPGEGDSAGRGEGIRRPLPDGLASRYNWPAMLNIIEQNLSLIQNICRKYGLKRLELFREFRCERHV